MFDIDANVVLFGGGTGSFTLLQELKRHVRQLTAVVNMSDDGGSTGVLRDELGVLPPGDIRQCLVALSDSPEVRNLFSYRFSEGRLEGQSLGNIILSGLELQHGSFAKAVQVAGEILHITGKVLPVTLGNHRLVMQDGDQVIHGEHNIDEHTVEQYDAAVRLEPAAALNPEVKRAIELADVILIAPGNIYCSILPIFAVDGMAEALAQTKAPKIYVANLVNKPDHTEGWHVVDYVKHIERSIGKGRLSAVFYNTAEAPQALLEKYVPARELPVDNSPSRFAEIRAEAIGEPLMAADIVEPHAADKAVKRSFIRHDAARVCDLLERYLKSRH